MAEVVPKVLVVDDDVQVGKALCRLLRRAAFEATLATSGAEAIQKLEALRPDAVISDFRMPGMDGVALLAEVERRQPRTLRLLVSGHADLELVAKSMRLGAISHYLGKPWDEQALVAILHEGLRRIPLGVP